MHYSIIRRTIWVKPYVTCLWASLIGAGYFAGVASTTSPWKWSLSVICLIAAGVFTNFREIKWEKEI